MNRLSWPQWTQLSLKISVIGLLMACGGIVSAPGGNVGSSPTQETISGSSNSSVGSNAAAPSLAGILNAPADDDNIVNDGTKKTVHFEAFYGPNYANFLDFPVPFLEPKDLKFLVKVGEASRPDCLGMENPGCWNWFDPNLLETLMVRATVITSALVGNPAPGEVAMFTTKWYYKDYVLGKITAEGFNLSLLDLKLKEGDSVSLELYEKKPDNYSPDISPLFEGEATALSTPYTHPLGAMNIGLYPLTPLTRKP